MLIRQILGAVSQFEKASLVAKLCLKELEPFIRNGEHLQTGKPFLRIRPEHNEWRFYRMEVWPNLFGGALLVRQWGRIGTEGRRRLDPHPDLGAAINALARLAGRKRRRGYQDRDA